MPNYLEKTVLTALSGGLDSCVLAALLSREHGARIEAMNFTYDSKHNIWESEAAMAICSYFAFPIRQIRFNTKYVRSNLLFNQGNIPLGHYTDESMRMTVVPGRNMMFISHLLAIAISEEIPFIALAVHQGDHAIYPDCRPEFIKAMKDAVYEASSGAVELTTPFLYLNKKDIVKRGYQLDVPFQLTRTCYQDQMAPCGRCGACRERLEAFELNGLKDPLTYELGDYEHDLTQ